MCSRPLKAFKFGKTKNDKDNYIITSYACHHIEYDQEADRFYKIYDSETNLNYKPIHEFVEIPCGNCEQCRLDYSKQWANRCLLEAKDHEKNCFITLTYNEDNVPIVNGHNPINGEIQDYKSLKKRDFQLFIKRLRKYLDNEKIRYFGCGEYGENTKRPHYHILIFGWLPDDLVHIGDNSMQDKYYYSSTLEKIWPYGNNLVAELNWKTAAYVARYSTKKVAYDNEIYDSMNIEKEFILMSRKPGIGASWYEQNKNNYQKFNINYVSADNGSIAISSNKYFDKLFEKDNPELLQEKKDIRIDFMKHKKKLIQKTTSLEYSERLLVDEKVLKDKTKILKREVI